MNKLIKKGFTLIELLVVIGILAVLMAGVIALIDPVDKLNQAGDSRMQAIVGELATGEQSYNATHNGFYAADTATLVTVGEIKTTPVLPNTTYAQPVYTMIPNPCTSGTTCTDIVICATLKSKRFTAAPVTSAWKFDSATGKTCGVATCATACP